jgi:hypothetical protein
MGYYDEIKFLLRGLEAGAIPGSDAINSLSELRQGRAEQQQARRQAEEAQRTGLLTDLVTAGGREAAAGTPMDSLRPLLDSLVASAGVPGVGPGDIKYGQLPGIDQLYEKGISTVNPGLDSEDEATIADMVFQQFQPEGLDETTKQLIPQTPFQDIRANIHSQFQGAPTYSRLAPSIDAVIEEAYNRVTKGY